MIAVRKYNDYFQGMTVKVPAIKKFILVTREADLAYQIKDIYDTEFPILVAVIPMSDSLAPDPDNISEVASCLIYVFQKKDSTATNFLDVMEATQNVMKALKEQIRVDKGLHVYPHIVHDIDLNRMHTDPEYDYLGCHGWSLSFNLLTHGF